MDMMRRTVLAALALAVTPTLALAGCGGDDQPAVLRLSGPSGGAEAALARGGGEPADQMIAPWGGIVYEVAGDLPALGGTGRAYRLTGRVTAEDVARIARVLGVEGEVRTVDGGFEVGSYETRFLTVSTGGAPSFGFGDATASRAAVACAEPADVTDVDGTVADCPEPAPLTGLPSADEARSRALTLLEQAGAFVDGAETIVDRGPYGVFVSVIPRVGGIAVPDLSASVAFGEQAAVTSAYGWLARPEAADEYPLLDVPTAIELLRSGEAYGPMLAARSEGAATGDSLAVDGTPAPDAQVAGTDGATGAGEPGSPGTEPAVEPGSEPAVEPAPVPEPVPAPEPLVVRISGVERTLMFFADADGGMWLLPGYRFISEDGGWWPVLAVERRFIELAG